MDDISFPPFSKKVKEAVESFSAFPFMPVGKKGDGFFSRSRVLGNR